MAKQHKFFWTGVDITTSLGADAIWAVVGQAVAGAKGKYALTAESPSSRTYDIKGSETLFATSAELSFQVKVSDGAEGRQAVSTHIATALLKDSSIPFAGKNMLGQKSYMNFGRALGAEISSADPSAVVSMREGVQP